MLSRRQLALLKEECLEIVPRSHWRWRSGHENAVLRKSAGMRTDHRHRALSQSWGLGSPDQTDDARSAIGRRALPLDHTRLPWIVGRSRQVEGAAGRAPCVVPLCARPAGTVWSTPVSLATPAGQTP